MYVKRNSVARSR